MSKYPSWPTTDQGNIVAGRVKVEVRNRFGESMTVLSATDQKDASLAELLAGTGEVFNVKSFGAKGDGVVDDTVAIQTAATAAFDAGGGVVFFPAGTYNHTAITFSHGVRFQGAALQSVTLAYQATTGSAFASLDQTSTRQFIGFSDLNILGPGSGNTAVGLNLSGISHSDYVRLNIGEFGTQILLDGTLGGSTLYNKFDHVRMYANSASSGFDGVVVRGSANAQTWIRCAWQRLSTQFLIGQNTVSAVPNEIVLVNPSMENVDTVAVDIVRGQSVYLLAPRFEGDVLGWRVAADSNNRGIVIDSPFYDGNTTDFTNNGTAVAMTGVGFGSIEQQSYGLSTSPGPNLIQNAGFESWAGSAVSPGWSDVAETDWDTAASSIAQEATVKDTGSYSIKAGTGSADFRGANTTAAIPVDPDKVYTLTFRVTTPHATNSKYRWAFRLFDSSDVVITTGTVVGDIAANMAYTANANAHIIGASQTPATADTFERTTISYKFPAGVASVRIAFLAFGSGSDKYVYVDNVYFAEGQASGRDLKRFLNDSGTEKMHGVLTYPITTLADDATPSVIGGRLFKTGGTTTITDLDDGVVGQTIAILSAHAVTITDGSNLLLDRSVNFVMAAGDSIILTMYNDQVWEEVSRKVNAQLDNLGIGEAAGAQALRMTQPDQNVPIAVWTHSHDTNPYGLEMDFSAATPDDNTHWFLHVLDGAADKCFIYSDGDLLNADGTYGAISDERFKFNPTPARSQWDDVKALAALAINYELEEGGRRLLSWSAQAVRDAGMPGLVMDCVSRAAVIDEDGNEIKAAESLLGLRTSVAHTKALIALGEALGRIETLEAQVAKISLKVT